MINSNKHRNKSDKGDIQLLKIQTQMKIKILKIKSKRKNKFKLSKKFQLVFVLW